jgi:hypothetical protein
MISAAVVWVPKNCQRYTNLSKPVELVPSGAERRRCFSAAIVWMPKNCRRYTNLSKQGELVPSGAKRRRSFP